MAAPNYSVPSEPVAGKYPTSCRKNPKDWSKVDTDLAVRRGEHMGGGGGEGEGGCWYLLVPGGGAWGGWCGAAGIWW